MLCLTPNFWDAATNVCQAKRNYSQPFEAGRRVTQGGPLLAKLFSIIASAEVHKWIRLMRKMLDYTKDDLPERIEALFTAFYVDDRYIASHDAKFLQDDLNILVKTFKPVGLTINTKKTQVMVCTPGKT